MKYTLPPLKKPKKSDMPSMTAEEDSSWYRELTVPITKEMVNSLSVGQKTDVLLSGEIIGLKLRERENKKETGELRLRISVVETEAENEFEKMAKEDEEDS